jgi:hypothetical protein
MIEHQNEGQEKKTAIKRRKTEEDLRMTRIMEQDWISQPNIEEDRARGEI